MASVGFRPCLILVDGSVQEYAWGKVGRDSMVSKLKVRRMTEFKLYLNSKRNNECFLFFLDGE